MIKQKDLQILDILKKNSKLTTSQISKKINMPITTVHNRIKKMEKEGVIREYTLLPDYKKLEKGLTAFILVSVHYTLPNGKKVEQRDIAQSIKKRGAEEVLIVTGGTDIIVKIRVRDVDMLNEFLIKTLRNIEGVDKTQTMVVLEEI